MGTEKGQQWDYPCKPERSVTSYLGEKYGWTKQFISN